MRVFVSSPEATESRAAELISALRSAGADVGHSPDPSGSSDVDPRWSGWYPVSGAGPGSDSESGIARALDASDVCVIVLNSWWDSSTWMAIEADEALARLGDSRLLHRNPDGVEVRSAAMRRYLGTVLPHELSDAVRVVLSRAGEAAV